MCLFSKLIPNPKYKKTKKNGGVIPPITDPRVTQVPIGCGWCMECAKQKAREWHVRLSEEITHPHPRTFITLTFNNESYTKLYEKLKNINDKIEGYEMDNWIATHAIRLFLERWRKKHKKSIKHWFITELGHKGTENIHIHGIIWTRDIEEVKRMWGTINNKTKKHEPYGYVFPSTEHGMKFNYVNSETINYITKYVTKVDFQHKQYKPKILTTPGIGKGYEHSYNARGNQYKPGKTKETYTDKSGRERSLPIYYRNKIYSEDQREKLWIEKLDKRERWVLGTKIDISTPQGEQEYWRAIKHAQKINKQLGYGGDTTSWEQTEYERQIRNLKQMERIKAAREKRLRREV